MRAATKSEVVELERQAFAAGWQDGLMQRACASQFPARSLQARKYLEGHSAGAKHRAFLTDRGMRYVTHGVEKTGGAWRWWVQVEGETMAQDRARTRAEAQGAAEAMAIGLAFSKQG